MYDKGTMQRDARKISPHTALFYREIRDWRDRPANVATLKLMLRDLTDALERNLLNWTPLPPMSADFLTGAITRPEQLRREFGPELDALRRMEMVYHCVGCMCQRSAECVREVTRAPAFTQALRGFFEDPPNMLPPLLASLPGSTIHLLVLLYQALGATLTHFSSVDSPPSKKGSVVQVVTNPFDETQSRHFVDAILKRLGLPGKPEVRNTMTPVIVKYLEYGMLVEHPSSSVAATTGVWQGHTRYMTVRDAGTVGPMTTHLNVKLSGVTLNLQTQNHQLRYLRVSTQVASVSKRVHETIATLLQGETIKRATLCGFRLDKAMWSPYGHFLDTSPLTHLTLSLSVGVLWPSSDAATFLCNVVTRWFPQLQCLVLTLHNDALVSPKPPTMTVDPGSFRKRKELAHVTLRGIALLMESAFVWPWLQTIARLDSLQLEFFETTQWSTFQTNSLAGLQVRDFLLRVHESATKMKPLTFTHLQNLLPGAQTARVTVPFVEGVAVREVIDAMRTRLRTEPRNLICDLLARRPERYGPQIQSLTDAHAAGVVFWCPRSRTLNVCSCTLCSRSMVRDIQPWLPYLPTFDQVRWVFVAEHWTGWRFNGPWFVGPAPTTPAIPTNEWWPLNADTKKVWDYYTTVQRGKPCTERWWMEDQSGSP